jgi:hypothetical protein
MQHPKGDNLGDAVEGAAHRLEAVRRRIPYSKYSKREKT